MRKESFIFGIFLLFSAVFAEEDYDKAVSKYKDIPADIDVEARWAEPYDETYLPYNRCRNVQNFEIVRVDERADYYWDGKDDLFDLYHYYCLVSIVRITYRVTCQNKLQYDGYSYFFSDPHKLNKFYNPSDEVIEEFKSHAHAWTEKPLRCIKDNGRFDESCSEFSGYDGALNREALIKSWEKQRVAFPEWTYQGEPGKKLPRPVIFVHGLNSSYDVWGVVPKTDVSGDKKKAEESFQKGLVKRYENGSAPDIIAKMQNLDNSEAHINSNGIYFFQAPGKMEGDEWREAGLEWDGNDASNSQSRKLYQQLIDVLDDFFGSDDSLGWRNRPELVVDIVAHSQGGLVVREMLRGLFSDAKNPNGPQNAANHIGKVVTVNTPHFGSELAAKNTDDLEEEFSGLKPIIDDLDAQEKGTPQIHDLITAKLDLYWYNYAYETAGAFTDGFGKIGLNSPLGIIQVFTPVVSALGWLYGATTDWITDVYLTVKGPYVGEYVPEVYIDGVGSGSFNVTKTLDTVKTMASVAREARKIRKAGAHLDANGTFMQNLGNAYPRRPDGTNVPLRPLYSPSTKRLLADLLYSLGEEASEICAKNDESRECFAAGDYFKAYAMEMAKDQGVAEISDVEFNDTLWNALVNVQDSWFSQSDIAVTEYSQKFINRDAAIIPETEPNGIKGFKDPRPYLFHDALAPWEDVLHMPVKGINDGSTKQGLDISCALDFYCDRTLQKQGAGLVYLEQGSVGLTGDFDIAPMFTESGVQEVTVSDGTHFLKATYRPKTGSFVTYTDGSGNAVLDTVIGASVSTTPSVSREGQNISVSFNNYSGKMYAKTYPMPKLAENVTYSVGNGNNDILPRVVAGVANATDLSTQMPPSTPKDKFFAKSSIFALHREARGEQESNTSRPRILVANSSDNDIGGFKVAYYFTADPARNPVVEIDYPKIPVTLENLGGDQWRFILDASDSILKARSVFPGMDGWQIRIHYDDWSDYRHLNDWSADYNVGLPKIDRKIVVYGKGGEILWGAEPKMFKSVDDGVVVSPKGTVSWKDAAPWEKNMFKPQVTVSNTGSVNLRNYHAKMWFRVPAGKTLQPPPEDWYTPESKPSLTNVGRNVWELDMFFDRHILYSKESVTEGNVGLRLTDWSEFDKLVCGIALVDSDGNAIYGQIPSIEACEAYDGPNLLAPQYARRDMR